jgi:sporulation protein YlmC with PRC-barrel domain
MDVIDAVLHLLDRQVVDRDGRMVCKVDDVELTFTPDGRWEVTGLLAGPPALVPRFGGRLGEGLEERWRRLGLQEADRLVPWRIPLALVGDLGSGVTVLAGREGLLRRQTDSPPARGEVRRRLNDALQLKACTTDGEPLGQVLDVRLARLNGATMRLVAEGLVIGRGRPGSYLGYDRDGKQGPWLLNRLVRWLHRHSGYVPMTQVVSVDWDDRRVEVTGPFEPLDQD